MVIPKATPARGLVALGLAAVVMIAGWSLLLPAWPWAAMFRHGSYDALHQLHGADLSVSSDSPVVIVYLDLNSFGLLQQDPTRPWSRELHAQLLGKLTRAGAKAVVFDIVFSAPGEIPAADDALAGAIEENQRTILAGESSGKNSHETTPGVEWTRVSTIVPPWERFASKAAGWGIASHIMDDDYVVRRYVAGGFGSEQQPSLTWAVAKLLQLPVTQPPDALRRANGANLRYYGPPLTIPHVSYAEALATNGTPENFFRDKIVFIGARPLTEFFRGRQDEFRSPYHSWANRESFHPGVEVHATEMLNLLRNDGLIRTSEPVELVMLLTVALVFGGGLILLRPVRATIVALAGAGVVFTLAAITFSRGVWFPWLIIAGAQIPLALGGSILFHSVEWYRARRRYEARIREQAALIDKAHDAILVQAPGGRITYVNPSAERLYGWTLAELQKDGAQEELFLPDAEAARGARSTALKDGEWNGELRQQTRAGQIITVASRWTLIRDAAGQPKNVLLINSDITEQKNLEQQFLRTQRMNTIGTLAGGMVHDLNNALAPILMGAQLLQRKTRDAEARNLLRLMETNTQRGADMVRQVLLFARGHGAEFERLELPSIVKELEKMVRTTFPKNIRLKTFVPSDLWPVRGNPTQLHQVLLNLCVNARDAMPDGGTLSFVADNSTLTAIEAGQIEEAGPGDFVSISVSDTGTGMSAEVRARIFEPFFTTKGEGRGTGIGLATVLRIVKAHGGFLRVESTPGEGTNFEVLLPRLAEVAPVSVAPARTESVRGRGELILMADDEQAMCELMRTELTSFGYRVLTAANGAEALAIFKEHGADVHLLITDNAMPVMDGRTVINEVRKLKPGLPVIFTSGEGDAGPMANVTGLGKPFALEELLAAIRRSLGG